LLNLLEVFMTVSSNILLHVQAMVICDNKKTVTNAYLHLAKELPIESVKARVAVEMRIPINSIQALLWKGTEISNFDLFATTWEQYEDSMDSNDGPMPSVWAATEKYTIQAPLNKI
jgi:hypothetical protein